MNPLRSIYEYFDMTDKDDHEPSEGYAGMHVAQQFVTFPQLYMEETVAEPVTHIQEHDPGIQQRLEESYPVFLGKLHDDPYGTYDAP